MATNPTEKLIVDLVADLAPVRRLAPVSVRMMKWLAVALVATAAAVWFVGLRADVRRAVASPDVLMSLGLAVMTFGSAAVVGLRLSVPGAVQSAWLRWLPPAAVALWISALVLLARSSGTSWATLMREPFHAACISRVAAIAVIPTLLLVREVKRGFALDALSTAALAGLGGSALAALAVQLVCPIDRPAHLLTSHVAPVLAVMLAATAIAGVVASGRKPRELAR